MQNTQAINVKAGNATATGSVTVSDNMPGVPCPDPAGYKYVGARYVPLFADPMQWDKQSTYEPLTIVLNEGNSYTSKQYVPVGIDITNEEFWALTGNYNAQIELYRKEVKELANNVAVINDCLYSLADFNGSTNEERLKNALDTIDSGTILCGEITFTTPYIAKKKDYRKIIINGATITLNIDYWFDQSLSTYNSVPTFTNCVFNGNGHVLYNIKNCIGPTFTSCFIDNMCIFNSDNYYIQSLLLNSCIMHNVNNIVTALSAYDMKITSCRVESASGIFINIITDTTNQIGIINGVVDDTLIEGRTDDIFKVGSFISFNIMNCYFEGNTSYIINQTLLNQAAIGYFTNNYISMTGLIPNYSIKITSGANTNFFVNGNTVSYPGNKKLINLTNSENYKSLINPSSSYDAEWNNGFSNDIKNVSLVKYTRPFTPKYNDSDKSWSISIPTGNYEWYSWTFPFYVIFQGGFEGSPVYRGFAILRVTPRVGYSDSNVTALCDVEVVDSCNSNNVVKTSTVTAKATLSNNSYNNVNTVITISVNGFSNNTMKAAVIMPAFMDTYVPYQF